MKKIWKLKNFERDLKELGHSSKHCAVNSTIYFLVVALLVDAFPVVFAVAALPPASFLVVCLGAADAFVPEDCLVSDAPLESCIPPILACKVDVAFVDVVVFKAAPAPFVGLIVVAFIVVALIVVVVTVVLTFDLNRSNLIKMFQQ